MPDKDKKNIKIQPRRKTKSSVYDLLKKKLSIHLQFTHGLHAVPLIHQKTNGVIAEEKTAWTCFVKI